MRTCVHNHDDHSPTDQNIWGAHVSSDDTYARGVVWFIKDVRSGL
jgi:hypothetical protein